MTKTKRLTAKAPTAQQHTFAKEYVKNGHDGFAAHKKAYGYNGALTRGHHQNILRNPKVQYLIAFHEQALIKDMPKSMAKLQELRDNSGEEKIQLDASKSLLSAYGDTVSRIQKLEEKEQAQTTNILIANMSDDELKARIRALIPGTTTPGTEAGPAPTDGGDSGVRESSTFPSGNLGPIEEDGEWYEKGLVPPAPGSPEIDVFDNQLPNPEDNPES